MTTDSSDPGLGAGLLTGTELPDEDGEPGPDPIPDLIPDQGTSKERIHAALFQGQPLPPERLGRFVLGGTLGRGGMGTVLEAHDATLGRKVALKVLHPAVSERHAGRLVREAQALAKLSHPNVVHVYEVGEVEGRTFVAMELVRGRTLRQWQEQEPRPGWRECVAAYLQAGRGLAAAHEVGLVHRDFKPGNCIIDDEGRVRVLDFGLVRALEGAPDDEEPSGVRARGVEDERLAESLTRTGAVLGTVGYMSPEQLEGLPVDARGDQFSFCASLYEALYGQRPFADDSLARLTKAVASGEVRPAPGGTAVPSRLRQVLLRGLAADPRDRWPSMTALLTELRHVVAPRIRVVSKAVKLGALALFWVCLMLGAAGLVSLTKDGAGGLVSAEDILYIKLHSTAFVLVLAAIFWHVGKLAALYEHGKLFTADNVRRLRAVGWLLMPLCMGVTLRGPKAVLDFQPIVIVAGLLFVFISWVMDEARRLE